jgi:hypothetical protein
LNEGDLPFKVRPASCRFILSGRPVVRGPTLRNIRDVNFFSPQIYRRKELGEKFTSSSNKWTTLNILLLSWGFPDKHHPRI